MATTRISRRRRTIGRSASKLSFNTMLNDVKQPIAIVAGMVIGKFAGDLLDKGINGASNVAATAGIKGLKGLKGISNGLIKSLVIIGGGLAAKQLIDNPWAKNIGIGMATYGGATIIQNALQLPISVQPNPTPTAGVRGLALPSKRMIIPALEESKSNIANPVVL